MNEIAQMYQRQAAIYRDSAREWRSLAADMPDGLAAFALMRAEVNEQQAQADETRANDLLNERS